MPRDSRHERQLKLDLSKRSVRSSLGAPIADGLPVYELVGKPARAVRWLVFRCGRDECAKLFALLEYDTEPKLKLCPHCFRSGKLPSRIA